MGRHCARSTCPFCGWHYSEQVVKRDSYGGELRWVECCGCRARGPITRDGKEEADRLWDRRVGAVDRHGTRHLAEVIPLRPERPEGP